MVLLAMLAVACGGAPAGAVSRDTLGDAWPLTVESGKLTCIGSGEVYFTADTPGKPMYAVNGLAMSAQPALPDIDEIWADDPSGVAPKKDLGPLVSRGLDLC